MCNIPHHGCISIYSTTPLLTAIQVISHFSGAMIFCCNKRYNISLPQDIESVHKQHFKWMHNIPIYGYTRIYSTILLLSNISIVSGFFFFLLQIRPGLLVKSGDRMLVTALENSFPWSESQNKCSLLQQWQPTLVSGEGRRSCPFWAG